MAATNTTEDSTTPSKRMILLSLDGGGVKGISSLLIIDRIMEKLGEKLEELGEKKKQDHIPRPWEVFDLAGGTSTGGLIALMLFRLRLDTKTAIEKFKKIAEELFSPKIGDLNLHDFGDPGYWLGNFVLHIQALTSPSRFPSAPLEKAIEDMLEASVFPKDTQHKGKSLLLNEEKQGRMFVCATRIDRGEAVLFRSYTPPDDAGASEFTNVDITSAACATSAAPTFLPAVEIQEVKFWDGGLLNNNPIDQVWDARYDVAPELRSCDEVSPEPDIALVLSVGTGYHIETAKLPAGVMETLGATVAYAANTKAKDVDFRRNMKRMNRRKPVEQRTEYFRFDTPTKESINIDDWQKMAVLADATTDWLDNGGGEEVDRCVKLLAKHYKPALTQVHPNVT